MKSVVDTVRIKSADLKNKFLFYSFAAFCAIYVGRGHRLSYVAWNYRFRCVFGKKNASKPVS